VTAPGAPGTSGGARDDGGEPQEDVDAVAEDFLVRLQAGEEVDTDAVIALHPELAALLRRRLPVLERLHRLARRPGGPGA
jgi:hypothetical protein